MSSSESEGELLCSTLSEINNTARKKKELHSYQAGIEIQVKLMTLKLLWKTVSIQLYLLCLL